jgi:hypothetical protein
MECNSEIHQASRVSNKFGTGRKYITDHPVNISEDKNVVTFKNILLHLVTLVELRPNNPLSSR